MRIPLPGAPILDRVGSSLLYGVVSATPPDPTLPWTGYFASHDLGDVVPLEQAWEHSGFFVFLKAAASSEAGLEAFATALSAAKSQLSPQNDLRFLWIANPSDAASLWQTYALFARSSGGGPSIAWNLSRASTLGFGEYGLAFANGVSLSLSTSAADVAVAMSGQAATLFGPADGATLDANSTRIPLTGSSRGAALGTLSFPTADGVDHLAAMRAVLRYATPQATAGAGENVRTFALPVIRQGAQPLSFSLSFDPLHPESGSRTNLTFLAVAGSMPTFASTFRTSRGYETTLTPRATSGPLGAGRLVPCRSARSVDATPGAPSWTYHLALDGAFDLRVVPPANPLPAGVGYDLMLGLSGSEYVALPAGQAILYCQAGQPAFVSLDPRTGAIGTTLDGALGTTSYFTVLAPTASGAGLAYCAQPQEAPLFSPGGSLGAGCLAYFEVAASSMPAWTLAGVAPPTLPIAPYAGADAADIALAESLETNVIAPTRRRAISAAPPPSTAAAVLATTPQGLLVRANPSGIQSVVLGNIGSSDVSFTAVGPTFQGALLADPQLLVVANPTAFQSNGSTGAVESSVRYLLDENGFAELALNDVPAATIAALRAVVTAPDGSFRLYETSLTFVPAIAAAAGTWLALVLKLAGTLRASIGGWTFDLSPARWRTDIGSPTIMIVKLSAQSLADAVADTTHWPWLAAAALPGEATADGTRRAIQAVFDRARARDVPEVANDDPYKVFYRQVVSDPSWAGILFLNAPVTLAALPDDLKFLSAGVDQRRFFAHHIGFATTPITTTSTTITPGQTDVFGLIDYEDPADLVLPREVGSPSFAFKTLALRAIFHNARLKAFNARAELMVNRLFDVPLTKRDPTHGNNLILTGSYQLQGNVPSYAFALEGENRYVTARSALTSIEVTDVTLRTTTAVGALTTTFGISGELRFQDSPRFDALAYGPTTNAAGEVTDGFLRFENLAVTMLATASGAAPTFQASLSHLTVNSVASTPRPLSMIENFPLGFDQLISVSAAAASTPEDLGYVSVSTPVDQSPMTAPWYGLVFSLDLGTLGALAGALPLSASILAAWGPGSREGDRPVYVGLRIGDGGPSYDFALQGVLSLSFRSVQFQTNDTAEGRAYIMRLHRIALTLLGFSAPPGTIDLLLFADGEAAAAKTLGWYAAYDGSDPKAQSKITRALNRRRHGRV